MTRWYYTPDNKQRLGPVTSEQLRQLVLSGTIRPEFMVGSEEGGKWVPAAKFKGLFPKASRGSPGLNGPAPSPNAESAAPRLASPGPANPPGRRRLLLAGGLVAGGLLVLCSCSCVIGLMSDGWLWNRTAPGHASSANRDDAGRPVGTPADFTVVELSEVYSAYEGNEAGADAKYLHKRVQFKFNPWAIDKDESGSYYAWANIFGLDESDTRGRHYKCYFRADQAAALAKFERGQVLTIRGVCAGKTGMVESYYAPLYADGTKGFTKASPAIAFKDCELVGKPEERPPPPSFGMHR